MRTKSFYLLMIFTSVTFMGIPVVSQIQNVNLYRQNGYVIICVILLDILLLSFYIISIIAFFNFVIKDSISNKFSHFYVNTIMFASIAIAVLQLMFIIGYLNARVGKYNHTHMAVRVGLELILLTVVFFWARELRTKLPAIKQTEIETEIIVVEKAESVQAEPEIEVISVEVKSVEDKPVQVKPVQAKVVEKPRKNEPRKSSKRISRIVLDAQATETDNNEELIKRTQARIGEAVILKEVQQTQVLPTPEQVVENQEVVEEENEA